MERKSRIWLILEKSDETRVSKSIVSYKDQTGQIYNYDSLVPNNKNLREEDFVIIRKENDILGIGKINSIISTSAEKTHKRCPKCKSTDIRKRLNKIPKWKCGRCAEEFSFPVETSQMVTNYVASIKDFTTFDKRPDVRSTKACALIRNGTKSQNSIIELDLAKVRSLLDGRNFTLFDQQEVKPSSGQGIGLTAKERKQVELRAMEVVHDFYSKNGWVLIDTSLSQPYDYLATKGNDKRFIEVKGTTGDGRAILLTYGEVNNVNNYSNSSILVIVSNILLEWSGEHIVAKGGIITTHRDPWIIDPKHLTATQFQYEILP